MKIPANLSVIIFSALAAASGIAFVYPHIEYWTQGANCRMPCEVEMFHMSICLGTIFFLSNLIVWKSIPADYDGGADLYGALLEISGKALFALLVAVPASFMLFGLILLPLISAGTGVWYLATLFSFRSSIRGEWQRLVG